MAALEPDDGPKKPATIFVKYNGAEFALCTLCPGSIYQQTLDLNFATGEEVTFFIKGSQATVDLTGYIMPEEDFDESQLSDDDGLSEQDMSEEEDDVSHDEDDLSMEEEDDDEEGVEEIVQKVKAKKPNEVSENATSQNKKKVIADKKNKKNSKTDNSMLADVVDAQNESISQDLSPQSLKRKLDESANTGETENKKKKKKKNKKKQAIDESLNSSVASDAGNTTADSPQPAKTENTKKSNNTPKRVLQGGIIMQDLKEGHGPVANNGKMVHVYYKGALKSGKEFDSCLSGKPFKFRLGKQEVIKGWDVGLSGMKVGGKRKLVIPANQAYGNKNLPGIPSNSTLMFDIELKAVN